MPCFMSDWNRVQKKKLLHFKYDWTMHRKNPCRLRLLLRFGSSNSHYTGLMMCIQSTIYAYIIFDVRQAKSNSWQLLRKWMRHTHRRSNEYILLRVCHAKYIKCARTFYNFELKSEPEWAVVFAMIKKKTILCQYMLELITFTLPNLIYLTWLDLQYHGGKAHRIWACERT